MGLPPNGSIVWALVQTAVHWLGQGFGDSAYEIWARAGVCTQEIHHGSRASAYDVDHNVFQACTFQWRSWLWIKRNLPIAFHKNMGACIVSVMDCEPGKLLDVMAKKAFFQFNRAEVVKFASLKHIQTEKDCSIP